jgi:8-oxo-dGTP pyrophosphatase MutT (NUDIX family)
MTSSPLPIDRIRERIRAHRYRPITDDERRIRHAVLVPFYLADDALHVVLTKRTENLRSQSGHVSFPGGGRELQDADLLATALRESHEEIGLEPAHVEVLGRIDDFSTRDGEVLIAGYAGLIDPARSPYPWQPSAFEVAAILEVPLSHLVDPANWNVKAPRELNGRLWPNEDLHFQGHRVFGATTRALRHVLELVFDVAS